MAFKVEIMDFKKDYDLSGVSWRKGVQYKREIAILELLSKHGRMRWKDINDHLVGKNRWIRGTRDLSDALKSLEESKKIKRDEMSYKNVSYMLTEDDEKGAQIISMLRQKKETLPKVLEEIRNSKDELTLKQAEDLISALIFHGLNNFLFCLEIYIRTKDKWADHTRLILLDFINSFGTLIAELGKTYPGLMNSAIETVKQELKDLTSSYAPRKWEVESK